MAFWNRKKPVTGATGVLSDEMKQVVAQIGQDGDAAGMAGDPRLADMVSQMEQHQPRSHEQRQVLG